MKEIYKGPKICVLKTDGVNCDEETFQAFDKAGGRPDLVHINEFKARERKLTDYQILALPGGFSYGDDVKSGKILAIELTSYLADQINDFTHGKGKLVLGVCNGFQVLVRTGLLPFGKVGEMNATLTDNDSGHFECRWINLKVEEYNACTFLKDMKGPVSFQVAHGEGKFYTTSETLQKIENDKLVVFRYCDIAGNPTQKYPENPNGAINAIAGITDPSGRILGLMPHPERSIEETQYPNWRRQRIAGRPIEPQGLQIFQRMVSYAAQM